MSVGKKSAVAFLCACLGISCSSDTKDPTGTNNAGTSGLAGSDGGAPSNATGGTGGGHSGAGGQESSGCSSPDDCTLPETVPVGCAEASCNNGECSYTAVDADDDGFRASRCTSRTPGIAIETGDDCNDSDDSVSPNGWDGPKGDGFEDGCNDDIDQDCNGLFDDGQLQDGSTCKCSPGQTGKCSTTVAGVLIEYPLYEEGEPVGICQLGTRECLPNGTWGTCTGAVKPAPETCDGSDNDCDGVASVDDEDVTDLAQHVWVCDADKDGRLAETGALQKKSCLPPPSSECNAGAGNWVSNPGAGTYDDCDDTDGDINPNEGEECDGKDNNCNDLVDATDPALQGTPSNPGVDYACQSGAWVIDRCPADKLHCDTNIYNGCETDATSLSNCHDCGRQCSFSCRPEGCDEVVQLAIGGGHACSVTSFGVAACWGRNDEGRLGNNSSDEHYVPKSVWSVDGFVEVKAGHSHSCGIAGANNRVYCWGSNTNRQVGQTGSTTSVDIPTSVGITNATSLATGTEHSCAVHSGGKVQCWGLQSSGRLANGVDSATSAGPGSTPAHRDGPTVIQDAVEVVAGNAHTCIINSSATVECWGDNSSGQLGIGSSDSHKSVAFGVPSLTSVSVVAAGGAHTCAISGTTLYCWGDNGKKQLGPNTEGAALTNTFYTTPQRVGLSNVTAVAAGASSTCAITGGIVRCWGSNTQGQRGDDSYGTSTHTPTALSLGGITKIWAGGANVCALKQDAPLGENDPIYCWGSNSHGQLGIGSKDSNSHHIPAGTKPLDN